jgi:tRNA(Ile)-lysidine synthetase-like protein
MAEAFGLLPADGRIFCAVSGGLDSMILLRACFEHRREHSLKHEILVLHLNHGLRALESDGDEELVRAEARKLGLPFRRERLLWQGERPSQALCRERRQLFFESEMTLSSDRLFLAHHQDDQAETVLLRLLRGSGLRGLSGMRRVAGRKIRPFLGLGRADLEAAAREWDVPWREDSSNRSSSYERNWLRLEILPLLEARRPGLSGRIAALAEEAGQLSFAESVPDSFAAPGWKVVRVEGEGKGLSRTFRLSRLHSRKLDELLAKGAGKLSLPGAVFFLSAGHLLVSKEGRLPETASIEEERGLIQVRSLLGSWQLVPAAGERVGFPSTLGLGDKVKKELQRQRVPVFFRSHLPLLIRDGRPRPLLPGVAGSGSLSLSPLGRWWLGA